MLRLDRLSMLIKEEVNRDQIKNFRKIDLKNHEEIILSSEFMELDLDEFKLLFNKTAWKVVEDLFEKNRHFFVCNICRENCDTNNKHVWTQTQEPNPTQTQNLIPYILV